MIFGDPEFSNVGGVNRDDVSRLKNILVAAVVSISLLTSLVVFVLGYLITHPGQAGKLAGWVLSHPAISTTLLAVVVALVSFAWHRVKKLYEREVFEYYSNEVPVA